MTPAANMEQRERTHAVYVSSQTPSGRPLTRHAHTHSDASPAWGCLPRSTFHLSHSALLLCGWSLADRPDTKHRMIESLAVPSGARNADFSPYRAVTPGGYLPMSRAYGDHPRRSEPVYGQRKPEKDVPDHKLNPYRFAKDKMKAITESGEPCTRASPALYICWGIWDRGTSRRYTSGPEAAGGPARQMPVTPTSCPPPLTSSLVLSSAAASSRVARVGVDRRRRAPDLRLPRRLGLRALPPRVRRRPFSRCHL